MLKRADNTPHTSALFIPPMSIGVSLNHWNTESYESNQHFLSSVGENVCVCVCANVSEGAGARENVCHSVQSVGICDSH